MGEGEGAKPLPLLFLSKWAKKRRKINGGLWITFIIKKEYNFNMTLPTFASSTTQRCIEQTMNSNSAQGFLLTTTTTINCFNYKDYNIGMFFWELNIVIIGAVFYVVTWYFIKLFK